MTALAQVNRYLSNHYDGMTPEQLILLLFKGALDRIEGTRQGIKEKSVQKRGENLSKLIAIVSELNASLNPEMNDESTKFLRGLYMAILTELPKVSLTNDVGILNRTEKYLTRLKEIWETDVMHLNEGGSKPAPRPLPSKAKTASPYGGGMPGQQRFNAISV